MNPAIRHRRTVFARSVHVAEWILEDFAQVPQFFQGSVIRPRAVEHCGQLIHQMAQVKGFRHKMQPEAAGKQDEVVVFNHGRFAAWIRSSKALSRLWDRRPIVEPPLLTLMVCGSGGFDGFYNIW